MCLNLNLKPKYDLYMYQNFIFKFLTFIDMPDFMTKCDLYLNQKMSHFAKIAGFKKLDKKWFCKYFCK